MEIYELGRQLLYEAVEEQRAAGTLEELPPSEGDKDEQKSVEKKAESVEIEEKIVNNGDAGSEQGDATSEKSHDEL